MYFTLKRNNQQTKKQNSHFLQDGASAGMQSLQDFYCSKTLPNTMEWTLDPILEKVEYVFSFFMLPGVQQRKHRTEFVSVQIVFFMIFLNVFKQIKKFSFFFSIFFVTYTCTKHCFNSPFLKRTFKTSPIMSRSCFG